MKYLGCCLSYLIISAAILMAATPLGTVTSAGPLTLDGQTVSPTAGSMPVVGGDVISTSSAGGFVYLKDGSRVTIDPNTMIQLKAENGSTVVEVRSGKVHLTKARGSHVRVESSKLKSLPAPGGKSKVPMITGTAAAGAAVAAATAAVSATRPAPRSPSCPPGNPQCQ